MKNPFGKVHKSNPFNRGDFWSVNTAEGQPFTFGLSEEKADFLVAAINNYETTEKFITGWDGHYCNCRINTERTAEEQPEPYCDCGYSNARLKILAILDEKEGEK
jgi:hypothetical protein